MAVEYTQGTPAQEAMVASMIEELGGDREDNIPYLVRNNWDLEAAIHDCLYD